MAIDSSIRRRLGELEDLPTLPQVMNRILETVERETSDSQELTRVLECDHAISARVLRLANSAFYGLPARVDSIQRAVVLVGFDTVRMLALATSVFDAFSGKRQDALDPDDFWMHALGAAKAAQRLAQLARPPAAADTCFTCGLIHDIGKFVMSLAFGRQYARVCQTARAQQAPLHEIERVQLKTTYAEVGAWLAEHWHFPAEITAILAHQIDLPRELAQQPAEATVVVLADALSCRSGFGNAGDPDPLPSQLGLGGRLGLDDHAMAELVAELEGMLDETRELFDTLRA